MNESNAFNLDELFGEFGLKECTLEDQIKILIPDAVFINGKNKNTIAKKCIVGNWDKLKFYKGNLAIIALWTQKNNACQMSELKSLMKSAGCDIIDCSPYENGKWITFDSYSTEI